MNEIPKTIMSSLRENKPPMVYVWLAVWAEQIVVYTRSPAETEGFLKAFTVFIELSTVSPVWDFYL